MKHIHPSASCEGAHFASPRFDCQSSHWQVVARFASDVSAVVSRPGACDRDGLGPCELDWAPAGVAGPILCMWLGPCVRPCDQDVRSQDQVAVPVHPLPLASTYKRLTRALWDTAFCTCFFTSSNSGCLSACWPRHVDAKSEHGGTQEMFLFWGYACVVNASLFAWPRQLLVSRTLQSFAALQVKRGTCQKPMDPKPPTKP